jgi:hypothetical protein
VTQGRNTPWLQRYKNSFCSGSRETQGRNTPVCPGYRDTRTPTVKVPGRPRVEILPFALVDTRTPSVKVPGRPRGEILPFALVDTRTPSVKVPGRPREEILPFAVATEIQELLAADTSSIQKVCSIT